MQSLSPAPRGNGKTGNTFLDTTQLSSFEDLVASKASDESRGGYLAILISNLLRTFNPDAIALGGGIVERRWKELEPQIWEGVKQLSPTMYWQNLRIYASQLAHPATMGAALLTLK
jgi:predicted NBD/HSP70 family sugar kinase